MRKLSPTDQLLKQLDRGLRTVFTKQRSTPNSYPANDQTTDQKLAEEELKLSARLMRVNHAGEMAAQGLYHGQALTAKDKSIRAHMNSAAEEENEHLNWCEERLSELNDQPSLLSPVWYFGSYAIGAGVGLLGDKWSLGFISETEKQVVDHLDKHLNRLPDEDLRSREIIQKIKEDEAHHDHTAQTAGANELPEPAKKLMSAVSKVMTNTAYWI